MDSMRGVQQADPLGPASFALAIHPIFLQARSITLVTSPCEIDITAFLLDDGVLAGGARASSAFLRNLVSGFASIGLDRSGQDKGHSGLLCFTDVLPFRLPQLFLDTSRIIGDKQWCESLLSKRVAKALALLLATGRFGDAHGAFTLLRSCAGWAKILCSRRTVPPSLQSDTLGEADADVRGALGRLAQEHAPAAYVASLFAAAKLSERLPSTSTISTLVACGQTLNSHCGWRSRRSCPLRLACAAATESAVTTPYATLSTASLLPPRAPDDEDHPALPSSPASRSLEDAGSPTSPVAPPPPLPPP